MDVICVLFLLNSRSKLSFVSVAFDFNASLNDVAPVSPTSFPVDLMRMEKSGLLIDTVHMMLFLCPLSRLSSVSVVFDFNASFNDVAPLSLKSLSVDLMRMEKSGLLMDVIRVLLLLCSQPRLTSISAMFDFNTSHSDVAPASPIALTVYLLRLEIDRIIMKSIDVRCFFCVDLSY